MLLPTAVELVAVDVAAIPIAIAFFPELTERPTATELSPVAIEPVPIALALLPMDKAL